MDIIKARIEIMKQMDNYIYNVLNDENILDIWLMDGVPDGADDEMLKEFACIENCWLNIIDCFRRCLIMAGVLNEET